MFTVGLTGGIGSGKSTVAAGLGLHAALYQPGALVLIASPSERQSKLLFRSLVRLYRALGRSVPAEVESRLSLELSNGSEVHALPGKEGTIRGFSGVTLLLLDEASRISDDLIAAVRPMLAVSGGALVALSTPYGRRGWFYEAWAKGGDAWERTLVTAHDCPRITPEFLASERLALGERGFAEEYLCQFLDPEGSVFTATAIDAGRSSGISTLFPGGIRDA